MNPETIDIAKVINNIQNCYKACLPAFLPNLSISEDSSVVGISKQDIIPAKRPGNPCKFVTPQVSWSLNFYNKAGVINL